MLRLFHSIRTASPVGPVATTLLLASLCACADLSAVAKFAKSAKDASTGFSDIVHDFAASVTRRSQYVSEEDKPTVLAEAAKWKTLEPDMLDAQKLLTDYIAALAAISTDSTKDRDATIKSSKPGLLKIGMTSSQADAGTALATAVTHALLDGYRSRKTGQVIRDCNPFLQEYLQGLEHVVGKDYEDLLEIEEESVRAHYDRLQRKYADKEPLAFILLRHEEDADLAAIAQRRHAADAYKKILTDLGEGHQKLYENSEHMSTKLLATLIRPYAEDIAKQSATVAKAY